MIRLYFANATPWLGERIDGVLHPASIGDLWSDAELAAIGLYRAYPPDEIPEGEQVGTAVMWDGVGIRFVLEDIPVLPPPDRVTSRQFFLQLDALDEDAPGTYDAVMGWVASQSRPVRDAFERSGTFVRDDAMLQQGFAALGFTTEQIDGFFTAAAAL